MSQVADDRRTSANTAAIRSQSTTWSTTATVGSSANNGSNNNVSQIEQTTRVQQAESYALQLWVQQSPKTGPWNALRSARG